MISYMNGFKAMYGSDLKLKTVLVVGQKPPPLGGVTVFVQRYSLLMELNGVDVKIVNPRNVFSCIFYFFRCDFVHVHTISFIYLTIFYLLGGISRVVVYDHNHSRHLVGRGGIVRKIFNFFFRNVYEVRVANNSLIKNYPLGVCIKVFSPFLPPDQSDFSPIVATYPSSVKSLLLNGENFFFTAAWRNIVENGEELYGLTAYLKVAELFHNKGYKYKFILSVGFLDVKKDANLVEFANRLPNVILMVGQYESWPLMMKAHAFIRNTSTDGDSVSVKEAIYFGTPVFASNSVKRPKGVNVFQKDNCQEICSCLESIINF